MGSSRLTRVSDDTIDPLLDEGESDDFFQQDGPGLFAVDEPEPVAPSPLPAGGLAVDADLPEPDPEPEEVVVVPGLARNEAGLSEDELAELSDDDPDDPLFDDSSDDPDESGDGDDGSDRSGDDEPTALGDEVPDVDIDDPDEIGDEPVATASAAVTATASSDAAPAAPAAPAAGAPRDAEGAPLALYRRYRPETFAEVIGQEHVTDPLQRALQNNKVNHAYLFSGPRGCGKTTSARILARCLNCVEGPTPTPCGKCQSCQELARGGSGSIDVIEIDAASHGGVDDARDLRERAFFAPVHSRYKIYIIDEAHMVTAQGFNALLKLVEEPPPHVKFIFATTEPEKVIGTIRSRTHHYPFRLVPPKVLQNYLGELCEREGVAVDHTVLPLVVRAGAGSVRDSLSVLDQLLGGAAEQGVTYGQASALLGYTPDALLDEIMDAFAAGDAAGVFATIDKVMEVGQDPRRFAEDLLRRLRDLVIVAAVPDAVTSGLIDVAGDQAERLETQANGMGAGELTRAAEVIAQGLTDMRGTTAPRLHLELMCARVLLPGADVDDRGVHARLDRIERRLDMPGGAPAPVDPSAGQWRPEDLGAPAVEAEQPTIAAPAPSAAQAETSQQRPAQQQTSVPPGQRPAAQRPAAQRPATQHGQRPAQSQRPAQVAQSAQPAAAGPAPQHHAPSGTATVADVRRLWPQVLDEVKSRRRFAWILLSQNAQVVGVDGGVLTLGFNNPGARDSFQGSGSHDVLRDCLVEVMGANLRVETVVDPSAGGQPGGHDQGLGGHGGGPGGGRQAAPTVAPLAAPEPGPVSQPSPEDTRRWTEQARQEIRPTSSGPMSERPEVEVLVSRDDDNLDESGQSAAELITRQLGGEVIGEE